MTRIPALGLSLVLVLAIIVAGSLSRPASTYAVPPPCPRPLDLPLSGSKSDGPEEDAPEVITFYGSEFEARAFFWCLDRSGTMGESQEGGGTALTELKQEMSRVIAQLSEETQFGIVRFSSSHQRWKDFPVRATPDNKLHAIGWIQSMVASGTTCIAPAMISTLEIAAFCAYPEKRVILVGDGLPMCPPPNTPEQNQQTLMDITTANSQGIPIDTIFIASVPGGDELFQEIADLNGGVFVHP